MTEDEQRKLVALLASKESERQGLANRLFILDAEILAHRTDLEGARKIAYMNLLDEELGARNLGYTLEEDEELDTYVVALIALPGGTTELGKIKAVFGSNDVSRVSTSFLLSYLNVPLPWSTV